MAVDASQTDYLLALFESGDMLYNRDVIARGIEDKEPTLADMTEKAIDILSKNEQGFYLFVEGGKIDSAHHSTYAKRALDETAELAKAVEVARKRLSADDTLIVVTADHSHTLTISGYPVSKSHFSHFVSGSPNSTFNYFFIFCDKISREPVYSKKIFGKEFIYT